MKTTVPQSMQERAVVAQARRLADRHAGRRLVITLSVPEIQSHEETIRQLSAELAPSGAVVEWVSGPGALRILRYVFDS